MLLVANFISFNSLSFKSYTMKKTIITGLVFGLFVLVSCGKNHSCEYVTGQKTKYSSKNYSSKDMKILKDLCVSQGGKWR